jgi:hypothetical protein
MAADYLDQGLSFAVETTFSSRSKADLGAQPMPPKPSD